MSAIVRTVLGDIPPEELGATLCHEHLIAKAPAALSDPDLSFGSLEGAVAELKSLAAAGGQALIEMTTRDYGRDVSVAVAAATASGVHVVQATGLQKGITYPDYVETSTTLDLMAAMVADIRQGIQDGGETRPLARKAPARAGVIKTGTCREDEVLDIERKVFEAAAMAHLESGAPISTHLQGGRLGHAQLDILEDFGVRPGRVLLGHVDRYLDYEYHQSLAARGAWLGYDQFTKIKYAPDEARVEMVNRLFQGGFERIMLAGDLGRASYHPAYGGLPGFSGMVRKVNETLDPALRKRVLVDNPMEFFSFNPE